MKALVLTELQKPLEVLNMPDPTMTPDGVIVRVEEQQDLVVDL
ncbi:hypothetical protein [Peribacillus cavernae]|nr:hypothetical protein [Peribacillus cavernae]MDQ0219914.1 D-arabinose 1-dehydrogenase-like Zn-dependent alcohol dehydrogenase [Peribacillus cavernae]